MMTGIGIPKGEIMKNLMKEIVRNGMGSSVMVIAIPLMIESVPRVAKKDGTRNFRLNNPFTTPTESPVAKATSNMTGTE